MLDLTNKRLVGHISDSFHGCVFEVIFEQTCSPILIKEGMLKEQKVHWQRREFCVPLVLILNVNKDKKLLLEFIIHSYNFSYLKGGQPMLRRRNKK